jgi:hypothetical protein
VDRFGKEGNKRLGASGILGWFKLAFERFKNKISKFQV